jgi:RimJ/RimL family protein N-acetyltransferase
MNFTIVPIAEEHIESFRAAVDRVAREHRYLALVDGTVVGWCDVIPKTWETLSHSGILGMGVIPEYRGRGIGGALIAAALQAAKEKGLTRIELTVRTDNEPARKLYEKFGFLHEGLLRRHLRVHGEDRDSYQMVLLF